jgi:hypothetical protein
MKFRGITAMRSRATSISMWRWNFSYRDRPRPDERTCERVPGVTLLHDGERLRFGDLSYSKEVEL